MNSIQKLSHLFTLAKIRIAIPVALSCFTGYILHTPIITPEVGFITVGMLLIVGGASALNHIQEYQRDALMHRTKLRPVPTKAITIGEALFWSFLFLFFGSTLLFLGGNWQSLFLAVIAIAWYNLVYTPLKRYTAFAVVPGALCGAFPPLIGWLCAGGNILHPTILALAFFFFIGQVPHFWLLLLIYSDDYKKAGFKVLTDIFPDRKLRNLTLLWIAATICVALLLPAYNIINSHWLMLLLAVLSIWLFAESFLLLKKDRNARCILGVFMRLNFYFLCVMLLIGMEQLLL